MKKHLKKLGEHAKKPIKKLRRKDEVTENAKVPYITNESVAEHREEVLSGARKFIYPLQHSKKKIVLWSSIIFVTVVIAFTTYSILGLYKFENTSTFMYRVTQIVPFPVAKIEGKYVSYESYLFELRHFMHYYETQQKLSFETEDGQKQLEDFKRQSMDKVINDTYVKHLAEQNGIEVSQAEVDQEIAIVRNQNRLGTSDQVFEDVLRDFWGWSVDDFKRSLRDQLLARKVASTLDTEAQEKAQTALDDLNSGAKFEDVAKKYSEDEATKNDGGDYGILIDQADRDIPAKITNAIFSQQEGEYSDVIDTGYSLEIVKTLEFEGNKARAAHIQINFMDINERIAPIKESNPPRYYLTIN